MTEHQEALSNALWRLYNRPNHVIPWAYGGNLPWDDPDFSERMLREHLDESHGAATRNSAERAIQIDWFWQILQLQPGYRLLDVTCGPGLYAVPLAQRGVFVTGVDFAPAALRYARELATNGGVADKCTFVQQDVRALDVAGQLFDATMLIYGQLAVMTVAEAQQLLTTIASALKPGGVLVLELLNPDFVDRKNRSWWFTDETGLWGKSPFLHLGERFWLEEEQLSAERFHILHLETGRMDEIILIDQVYNPERMVSLLRHAGFDEVTVMPDAAGLPLYDAREWIYYTAVKPL